MFNHYQQADHDREAAPLANVSFYKGHCILPLFPVRPGILRKIINIVFHNTHFEGIVGIIRIPDAPGALPCRWAPRLR
jgi:hypothetical protein